MEREDYIREIFLPKVQSPRKQYLPEEEVDVIVKKISDIGSLFGFIGENVSSRQDKYERRKHKYDVWIAKEAKKNIEILDKIKELRLIFDWAVNTKSDIFKYNFEKAMLEQEKWHRELINKYNVEDISIEDIDNERIIFRCSDKTHFFYLLEVDDLEREGALMGNCIGGDMYKSRLRNIEYLYVSLRDSDNEPHVVMEINTKNKRADQIRGKENKDPVKKYKQMIVEFILFVSGYEEQKEKELLKFLNLNYF